MQDMTDEEADALDEYFTKNLPKTDPTKGGVTTRQGFRMVALDKLSEDYLFSELKDLLPLSQRRIAEIKAFPGRDFSDNPEWSAEDWKKARPAYAAPKC